MELQRLIGVILPPAIDLINRKVANTDARFWISIAFCMLIATIFNFLNNNGFTGLNPVLTDFFWIWGLSQISYKVSYKDSELKKEIRA